MGRTGAADVPYLTKGQIKREAAVLLEEYAARHGPVLAPPVPVDDIVEVHLQLTVEYKDLRAFYGAGDVLGEIWFAERAVRVDVSLDPALHPGRLGRYRFTLAHEAGHWRLHRRLFLADSNQTKLFGDAAGEGEPAYVCRSGEAKRPVEWQADYFAAHLLMPSNLLRAAWEGWHGSLCPVGLDDLVRDAAGASAIEAARRFVRPLAERFEVSAEAMQIRLEELGLLLKDATGLLY